MGHPAGNRTAKTNKLNNITEQYTYDPIYQLAQVVQGATTTESYSHDAVGNRLSSLGVSSYIYNSSNELTSTSGASFTYDANGNTLTKTNASGTTQYAWDFENRLRSVITPTGTAAFAYDAFGRRIQKTFTQGSTTTTINYVYDEANVIEEVDAAGNLLARYAQGGGIDEPLAQLRSGASALYEADALGSVTSLSSSTGTISNSYTYDAFGNATVLTGSFVNPYRYTARDYDPETGLQYSRARYYDATTGRFLSEDPIGFDGGIDFYSYVGNRPTNSVDPDGLQQSTDETPWYCSGNILSAICDALKKKPTPSPTPTPRPLPPPTPIATCTCTRVQETPRAFSDTGASFCAYTCPCRDNKTVVMAMNAIKRVPSCRDRTTCPYTLTIRFFAPLRPGLHGGAEPIGSPLPDPPPTPTPQQPKK